MLVSRKVHSHSDGQLKLNLSRYSYEGEKGERKYNSYSFLTSILDWVSGQRHAPAALYPRYRLDRRLDGHHILSEYKG
jgi:hypothetical protein